MMLVPDERVALLAWVKSTSHSNVVIDDSVNALVSIKNLSIRQISVTALRLFCVHHQISGYKNKSKEVTCMLIIQWTRMKAIRDAMYHQPLEEINSDGEDNINKKGDDIANLSPYISTGEESKNEKGGEPIKKKRKNRKCKATTPEAITKPGSYYRIINTYMLDENRPHVLKLGSIPTMAALDSRKFLHKEIYDKLLSSYNDITNNAISGFAYPEVEYFQLVGVCNNVANDFDCISSADFSDAMGYLNFHYQVAHRNNKASGFHDDFAKFVGNRPYLLYYHLWLIQTPCLQNFAVPTLPASVMRDSLLPCPQWSPLSSGMSVGDDGPTKTAATRTTSLIAELGRGNTEKLTLMKERNEQNERIVSMASEKHAIRKEIDLSKLVSMHRQSLSDARQELKALKASQDYDSDSPEVKESKAFEQVLSERYNRALQDLAKHSRE